MNYSSLKYHDHLAEKLNDPKTAAKTYWSILKTFVNGSNIPLTKPQSNTIFNNSSLPKMLTFETENRLSTFDFNTDDIVKFIKVLDPNKAHGHVGISIRMIKLHAFSMSKPLHILFKNCLGKECFPNEWKEANNVPSYKKGDKAIN